MLRRAYHLFNERDIDGLLADMTEDVDWPNVAEGTRLHGHNEVRAYWEAQFAAGDPRVEPLKIDTGADGTVVVSVHQHIHDLEGRLLHEADVEHVYTLRDDKVARMEVRSPATG